MLVSVHNIMTAHGIYHINQSLTTSSSFFTLAVTLLVTWYNIDDLAPNADFAEKQRSKRLARRKANRLETTCHSPVPSPMLGKKLASNKKKSNIIKK